MPIPANVTRISLVGHAGASEIFDTSVWCAGAPTTPAAANTFAATLATGLGTSGLLTDLVNMIMPDSGYDEVRVYGYPTGGPTASVIGSAPITGGVGVAGNPSLPLQVALVATLESDLAGRRHRGRMYFPMNGGGNMGNDHYVQAGRVDGLCAGLVAWLSNFDSANRAVIVSRVAGSTTPVTHVKVDNRPDIQRRRANRQLSTHTIVGDL